MSLSGDQPWAVQELLRSSPSTESLTQSGGALHSPHSQPAREMLINNPKYEPVQCGYRQGYAMNGALSAGIVMRETSGSRLKGDAGGV